MLFTCTSLRVFTSYHQKLYILLWRWFLSLTLIQKVLTHDFNFAFVFWAGSLKLLLCFPPCTSQLHPQNNVLIRRCSLGADLVSEQCRMFLTSQSMLESLRWTTLGQHMSPSALVTCIQQWQIPYISQDSGSLCSTSSHFCSVEDGKRKPLPDHHYMQNYTCIWVVALFTLLHHRRTGPALQKCFFLSQVFGLFFLFPFQGCEFVSFEKLVSYILAHVI